MSVKTNMTPIKPIPILKVLTRADKEMLRGKRRYAELFIIPISADIDMMKESILTSRIFVFRNILKNI